MFRALVLDVALGAIVVGIVFIVVPSSAQTRPIVPSLVCQNGRVSVEWHDRVAVARCATTPGPRAVVVREEWTCDAVGFCHGIANETAP